MPFFLQPNATPQGSFIFSGATTGDTGVVNADLPLIYNEATRTLSVQGEYYAFYIHTHPISQVVGLQTALDGKQPTGDYATNAALTSGLAGKQPIGDYATETELADGLLTKANVVHTHTIQQVDGLEDELDGKQPVGDYATQTDLTTGLAGKANTIHTHDASAIVSGTIDIARIPVIPSQVQVFANEADITQLTPTEQAEITGAGVVVVLTNGERWIYKGTGSKTDYASYVQLSDLTPDWNSIENKPSTFPPSSHTHPISQVIGLQDALDGKSPLFDQPLNSSDSPHFANVTTSSVTIDVGANPLILDITGITFPDATQQSTAGVSPAYLAGELANYATTSWVTSQGYLTAPYNPFNQSLNTSNTVSFYNNGVGYFSVISDFDSQTAIAVKSQFGDGSQVRIRPQGIRFENTQYGGNYLYLDASGGITFPDGTTQTTAFTGGAVNPFDQSLNTTNAPTFANIDAFNYVKFERLGIGSGEIPQFIIKQNDLTGTYRASDITLDSAGIHTIYSHDGITFPNGSVQTTAYTGAAPYNQSLNTTDSVQFNSLTCSQGLAGDRLDVYNPLGGSVSIIGSGTPRIIFSDLSTQTTAFNTSTSYTFSQPQTITTTSASAALTVTQTGAGNSFVVNDQAGDPTPFVINNAGLVGINVTSPAAMLDIAHSLTSGTGIRLAVASGQSFSTAAGLLYVNIQNTGATGKGLVIENRGTGDCLYIHDTLATDTTPFVVDNDGNCIIGGQTITAGYKLDVVGNAKVSAIKIGSSDNLSAVNYTTSGQPATVDRAVYPNEIQVVINGITYAMPARAV